MALTLSKLAAQQLAADHRKLKAINVGYVNIVAPAVTTNDERDVELLEDLFAADSYRDAPEYAQALVLQKGSNGKLVPMVVNGVQVQLRLVNRMRFMSFDQGTPGVAKPINGEWRLTQADCPGGSSSSGSV